MVSSSIGPVAGIVKRSASCTSAIVGRPSQPPSGCCARLRRSTTSFPTPLQGCSRRSATGTDRGTTSAATSWPRCATAADHVGSARRTTRRCVPEPTIRRVRGSRTLRRGGYRREGVRIAQPAVAADPVADRSRATVGCRGRRSPSPGAKRAQRRSPIERGRRSPRRTSPSTSTRPDEVCERYAPRLAAYVRARSSPTASEMRWSDTSSTASVASRQ